MSRISSILLLTLCLFCLSSCSLLLNLEECAADGDCASGQTCSEGICEGESTCAKNSDCPGANNYCFVNQCAALEAERCQLGAAFDGDEAIVPIGALMPLSGLNGDRGRNTIAASTIAIDQINQTGGASGKPFGLMVCDTAYDPDTAVKEANYLKSLGVRAIIGGFSSSETVAVANQVTIPSDMLLVTPASTAPTISGLQDNDLVWRTVASDALQGPAIGELLKDVLTAKNIAPADAKVALLSVDSVYGNGLSETLVEFWSGSADFKGLPASATNFYASKFEPNTTDFTQYVATLSDALYTGDSALKPDVIIIIGATNALSVISELETVISTENATPKPTWILSEAMRDPQLLDNAAFQDVRTRIQGTVISQTETQTYTQFITKYGAAKAADYPFADKSYDAAYVIAIALASYTDLSSVTGADLAARLKKMADAGGTAYQLLGSDFNNAARDLAEGKSIDVAGASGALDFQNSTGDVFSDISAWSIDTSGSPTFKNGRTLVNSQ